LTELPLILRSWEAVLVLGGVRIPVSVIVGQIAHGASFEEILEGYPDLEKGDIH